MKPLSAKELVRVMLLSGFTKEGVVGSHYVLKGADNRRVTIPNFVDKTPLKKELVERVLFFANLSL